MATETAVVIPFAGTDPDRTAAYHHIADRLAAAGHEVVTGSSDGPVWCKADAVADALSRTEADVLVIHDADVWCDGLAAAVDQVEAGAPWAVPHRLVRRLDRDATARIHKGTDTYSTELRLDQRPYVGHLCGGITVVRREVYEGCPLDSRFHGWGQEDDAWAVALGTLYGLPWRGTAPLWHHWHTLQDRRDRFVGSDASEALYARYLAAKGNPTAMCSLIDEGRVLRRELQQPVADLGWYLTRPFFDTVPQGSA